MIILSNNIIRGGGEGGDACQNTNDFGKTILSMFLSASLIDLQCLKKWVINGNLF